MVTAPRGGGKVRAMMREKGTEDGEGRSFLAHNGHDCFAQICAKNEQCTATIGRVLVRGDSPEKWTVGGER